MHTTSSKPILTNAERSPGEYSSAPLSASYSLPAIAEQMDARATSPALQTQTPLELRTASPLNTTSRTKVAFVDLDHTVSDAHWRDHLLKPVMAETDWHRYHSNGCMDNPIREVRDLVRALFAYDYEIVILTARPEFWRRDTLYWLDKNQVPFHTLVMRPNGDHTATAVLKLQQARNYLDETEGDKQVIIIDDHEEVCEAFCQAGATVLRAAVNKRPNCRKFTRQG
jgi:hypothetical protein